MRDGKNKKDIGVGGGGGGRHALGSPWRLDMCQEGREVVGCSDNLQVSEKVARWGGCFLPEWDRRTGGARRDRREYPVRVRRGRTVESSLWGWGKNEME